jgi:hypothetical protein
MTDSNLIKLKNDLFNQLTLRLGGQIIDLELDPEHFEAAYKYTFQVYRQRAQNSTKESYTLMSLIEGQNKYVLPPEFIHVKQLFRRTTGLETGPSSSSFDPFSASIMNTYLLNYNLAGGLASYDFYSQYVELTARMFGGYIIFTFNPVTKELVLVRNPKGTGEQILIWADIQRPEIELLLDPMIAVWIQDFCLATLKQIIGEAREKFGSIVGPGGGTSLNGAAMKSEAKTMQDQLIDELKRYVDGSTPLTWVMG